jgi:hypothetical protein
MQICTYIKKDKQPANSFKIYYKMVKLLFIISIYTVRVVTICTAHRSVIIAMEKDRTIKNILLLFFLKENFFFYLLQNRFQSQQKLIVNLLVSI